MPCSTAPSYLRGRRAQGRRSRRQQVFTHWIYGLQQYICTSLCKAIFEKKERKNEFIPIQTKLINFLNPIHSFPRFQVLFIHIRVIFYDFQRFLYVLLATQIHT